MAEGDALDLVCNGSNCNPQPTLQWLSPAGEKVSDSGQLVIINTNRTMTGLYTCVATLPNSTMSLNTTVTVAISECGHRITVLLTIVHVASWIAIHIWQISTIISSYIIVQFFCNLSHWDLLFVLCGVFCFLLTALMAQPS